MIAATMRTGRAGRWRDDRRRCRRQPSRAPKDSALRREPASEGAVVPMPGARSGRPWQVHQGKELSYTNLLDLDAALRIALEFTEPAGVVIKHTNPCGVATGATLADAYVRAREADPLSAFGGIVGLNRPLDAETARALTATFIEAVIAPGDCRRGAGRSWRRRRTCAWSRRISRRSRRSTATVPARRADVPRRRADAGTRPCGRGARAVARRRLAEGRDQARADRRGVGRRCGSPGASART